MATNPDTGRRFPRIGFTIDCPDPDAVGRFWERHLGYTRRAGGSDGTYVTIDRPEGSGGPPHITFQRVPEAKETKARAHLDLFVDHAQPMLEDMLADGASVVHITEAGDWTTRILLDPAGNEFCVIGPD